MVWFAGSGPGSPHVNSKFPSPHLEGDQAGPDLVYWAKGTALIKMQIPQEGKTSNY